MPKTFCEFFAGIGLVREALRRSGWQCVYANDCDPRKRLMHEGHFGESPEYHEEDVWKTSEVIGRIPGRPTLATASFPCTDMSLAGRMAGFAGSESSAFFGFAQVLEELGERRPPLVLLENVVGFLSSRDGADFAAAATRLADLGYWLDAWVLDARRFVPQSRPRLFLAGYGPDRVGHPRLRDAERVGEAPTILQREVDSAWQEELRPPRLRRVIESTSVPTGWLLSSLSPPAPRTIMLDSALDQDDAQPWWPEEQVERHWRMMSSRHRERVQEWLDEGATAVATVFRRIREGEQRAEVRLDGLAGCLRTPRGGSARQIVLSVRDGELRMRWMTPREYARLQGAGDYRIEVGDSQALFGFGDAVCVPAIEWIDRELLTPLSGAGRPTRRSSCESATS